MSAGPSGPLTFGYLNRELNRKSDLLNVIETTVSSPVTPIALWHWDALLDAHLKYRNDCIPYEATVPWTIEPPFPQSEHNSNSYIAGLLDKTTSFLGQGSMHDYVLGNNPVPNIFYTEQTPCGYP